MGPRRFMAAGDSLLESEQPPGVGAGGAASVDLLDGDHPVRAESLGRLHLVAQRLGGLLQDHLDLRVLAGAVDDAEDLGRLLLAEAVALAEVEVDAHAQPARHQAGITAVAHTSTSIPGNARLWSPTSVEALGGKGSPSSASFMPCVKASSAAGCRFTTYIVLLTTCSGLAPAAASAVRRLRKACAAWAR